MYYVAYLHKFSLLDKYILTRERIIGLTRFGLPHRSILFLVWTYSNQLDPSYTPTKYHLTLSQNSIDFFLLSTQYFLPFFLLLINLLVYNLSQLDITYMITSRDKLSFIQWWNQIFLSYRKGIQHMV